MSSPHATRSARASAGTTADRALRASAGRGGSSAERALRAVAARIRGEWDQPDLVRFGPLGTDTLEDVLAITDAAVGR